MTKTNSYDIPLLITVLVLVLFGLIMIASIGVPKSIALTKPAGMSFASCNTAGVDCYFIAKKHLIRIVLSMVAFLFCLKFPFKYWRKFAVPFFAITFLLLIFVQIGGTAFNTSAKSWLLIFNTSFQPTEFAKLALIFYFAAWFSKKQQNVFSFKQGFISFCIISGVIILPVISQPDLGSTLVLTTICVTMYFIAGARMSHLLLGALIAVSVSAVLISQVDYLNDRFSAFSNITNDKCEKSFCWQSRQASIAVGSGGLFGKGLAQGVQKSYWLPQATDDFIFAASAEELGFFRVVLLVLLFFLISVRGYSIAKRAPNKFAMLTAAGITSWITAQAFINISVNIGLLPITGITLPFVSFGGSSMLSSMMGIGILLNISKNTYNHATPTYRRRYRRTYSA